MAMNGYSHKTNETWSDELNATFTSTILTTEWSATKLPFENAVNLKVDFYITNFDPEETGTLNDGWCIKINDKKYPETSPGETTTYYNLEEKTLLHSVTAKVNYESNGTMNPITITAGEFNNVDIEDLYSYTDTMRINITLDNLHNIKVKKNNEWKPCNPFVKVNGVWKRCIVWKKINGTWKRM